MSLNDKLFIDTQIALHNAKFGLQYQTDSIDRRTELMTGYMRLGNTEASANKYVDSINKEIYKKDENWRYNPTSDPYLTFEKFMDYCEKNKYQSPRQFAEQLNPKEEK